MSRKIFIILGGIVILLSFGFWIYLLIFQNSQESLIESWFGGVDIDPTTIEPFTEENTVSRLGEMDGVLTQLTTRSVAGLGMVYRDTGSSTPPTYAIRYAETGTGHVYEIDLQTATESRLSGLTLAKTINAHFDPDGQAFVLTAERGNNTESKLYTIKGEPRERAELPTNSRNIEFIDGGLLRYTVVEGSGTYAFEHDVENNTISELWYVPVTQIKVHWLPESALIINLPSSSLKGGLYEVNAEGMARIIEPKLSLSAVVNDDGSLVWYSHHANNSSGSLNVLLDRNTNATSSVALPAIPEKCYLSASGEVCAISTVLMANSPGDLNRWYRGEFTSSDLLWVGDNSEARLLTDLEESAGHTLDVDSITPTPNNDGFIFINKTNRTLWRYSFED